MASNILPVIFTPMLFFHALTILKKTFKWKSHNELYNDILKWQVTSCLWLSYRCFIFIWLYWCLLYCDMGMHGWPIYILSSLVHYMYFIACMCVRLLLYHVLLSALLLCLYLCLCVCVCVCLVFLSLSFIIVLERLLFNVDLLFRAIHASAHHFQ